jgi:hypothetical protein
MPDQEEVDGQIELLTIYRRSLSRYLRQQAQLGEAYAPPAVFEGIHEARENIRRIKGILRSWRVNVEDHPNDEDVGKILQLELVRADGTKISNPSQADIEDVLNSLQGGADEFAILERRTSRGEGFIQVLSFIETITGDPDDTKFVLEYYEGSSERHYQAIDALGRDYTRKDVISVFQSYANGDDSWKGKYNWEKVKF